MKPRCIFSASTVLSACTVLWLGWPCLPAAHPAEPLDRYGGFLNVAGHAAASFHLERIGKRWWLVTPEGHGTFIRAVSKVDTSDYGSSGGSSPTTASTPRPRPGQRPPICTRRPR